MSLGLRARRALLGWIGFAVAGTPVQSAETSEVDRDLALLGFRKAARGFLLRRMAAAALREGEMTILSRCLGGRFVLASSGGDQGVGWEILERGTYEPHIVRFYERTLRPGMTVLDVGANIGFHALHAASLVGSSGSVFAIEPDPQNAALLRMSASHNPGLPLRVIEAALSDAEEELVLTDLGNASNSGARFTHADRASLLRLVHGPNPRFREVAAFPWDLRHLDTPVHLVKLDVEGFEPKVAGGMERSLARHRPIVLSEYAPSNLQAIGGVAPGDYLRWFVERGYAVAVLEEGTSKLLPCAPEAVPDRLRGSHHVDVVFSPVGRAGFV